MTRPLTIALDAMGGDCAPKMIVDGADLFYRKNTDVRFIFFGDEVKIKPLLGSLKVSAVSEVHHTDIAISNTEKPSAALRSGKQSSMRLAIDSVAEGRADCIVSAGNTGALMAMALFGLRPLPGIDRPAIATVIPSLNESNGTVMLDLGANIECDAKNLVQFSILGGVYSREILKVSAPKIGLLNVGSEEMKGNEQVKEAASLLSAAKHLPGKFVGFVEGTDISSGAVDVVVTDGFTGNISLKTIEGTAKLIAHMMKAAFKSGILPMLGFPFALPALRRLKDKMDPRKYNGAPLVGLKGLCVKSHGGTDAIGFANAIKVAHEMVKCQFNEKVAQSLQEINLSTAAPDA